MILVHEAISPLSSFDAGQLFGHGNADTRTNHNYLANTVTKIFHKETIERRFV